MKLFTEGMNRSLVIGLLSDKKKKFHLGFALLRRGCMFVAMMMLTVGCQSKQESTASDSVHPDFHQAVVLEVMNTRSYTYLRVKENGSEKWLALPLMEVKTGETYYYGQEMVMTNFRSKELNRTFETIYFIDGISTEPPVAGKSTPDNQHTEPHQSMEESIPHGSAAVPIEKKDVKIEPAKGGISIAELYSGKAKYAGKTIRVTGRITKFSPEIMNRNWVHLQDGTDFNGKFDLTISTSSFVKVDDTVTFEGKISLDKDFGAGYFYEVIMEDAIVK